MAGAVPLLSSLTASVRVGDCWGSTTGAETTTPPTLTSVPVVVDVTGVASVPALYGGSAYAAGLWRNERGPPTRSAQTPGYLLGWLATF